MTFSARQVTIRDAASSDCTELAQLINFAGEDPWEIGRQRAVRDTGSFSYRNSVVAELDGKIAGALVGYPLAAEPEPIDTANTPPMFIPLLELENLAAGTWYVNAVATFPEARGSGVGSKLMRWAGNRAHELGLRGVSLIVSDANRGAQQLYERLGYSEVASRKLVKEQWQNDGENWVLMLSSQHS